MSSSNRGSLAAYGWNDEWEAAFAPADQNILPARVAIEHRSAYLVHTELGEAWGQLTGKLRFDAESDPDRKPAVGDWVAARLVDDERVVIVDVLPRKTKFVRKQAGMTTSAQVVAANVDSVFVVSGLDDDLNPRRIERYLTLGWESGAFPVVVLTKADLCPDLDAALTEVAPVTQGIDVHVVSGVTGAGVDDLRGHVSPGRTVAFVGSSGVGKSTLINRLVGAELQQTAGLRHNGKGRHTTTTRELIVLPGGGVMLDTPGMRELQLWDAPTGIEGTFEEITEAASRCRFSDCSHTSEPGCAVREAIRSGRITEDRLESYRKLQRELSRLERKQARAAEAAERRRLRRNDRHARNARKEIYEHLQDY